VAEVSVVEREKIGIEPLLTVAMPVFNAGKYLRLAVLSVIAQSFKDWELLVIDDGSTDGALQDIADIQDRRVRVLRDGLNKGLAARLNEAIDKARGRYLARMDQDDFSYPERFSMQIELLKSRPELDVVSVRAITISDDNEITSVLPCPLSHEEICARPWQGFCFPHPAWMGRIEWFRKHRYATPGPYFCEDQELLLRTYSDSRFGAVDKILFAYRVRERNNWSRVAKTRWTFFRLQFHHFVGLGKYRYVFLALLVLGALVARDLVRMLKQWLGVSPYSTVNNPALSAEWQGMLQAALK
jgi:glycosyltransferase involved in cell wall biosynthesis